MEMYIGVAQERLVIFFEALERFSAVEADGMDIWVFGEQGSEIVALLIFYIGVEAALPVTESNGIPKGNMVAQQHGKAIFIACGR